MQKLSKYGRQFLSLLLSTFSPLIKNDALYLKLKYYAKTGRKLNLKSPTSLNEKLQWLKINEKNEDFTDFCDKYKVKEKVAEIIGSEYIIPLLGVWDSFDDIDFSQLPDKFVLKCNHDSGGIVICEDKSKLDIDAARKKINKAMHAKSLYDIFREYPYKNIERKIIAEQYLVDESGWQLKDYKVFCFNGEPEFIEVDYDRYVDHKLNVYDLEWNFIDFYMTSRNDRNVEIPKPQNLKTMLELARKLAKGTFFVRVDFYSIGEKLYFGELTYFPGAGFIDFHPTEYDIKVGKMLKLPTDK